MSSPTDLERTHEVSRREPGEHSKRWGHETGTPVLGKSVLSWLGLLRAWPGRTARISGGADPGVSEPKDAGPLNPRNEDLG